MLSEQPIELVFDHPVLADGLFQLLPVEDLDVAADVTNRSRVLQATGSAYLLTASHPQNLRGEARR
jgi:hypothetical protein